MLRGMVLTASFSSGVGGRFKISRKVLVMGSLGDSFWALSAMSFGLLDHKRRVEEVESLKWGGRDGDAWRGLVRSLESRRP